MASRLAHRAFERDGAIHQDPSELNTEEAELLLVEIFRATLAPSEAGEFTSAIFWPAATHLALGKGLTSGQF